MKKALFIGFAALAFVGCTITPEKKASSIVEKAVKSSLYHPNSYDPIGRRKERLPPRLERARLEQVPRLGYANAATFRQCSSKLDIALNFRSSHHGRGALQLADEDLPPEGRRTLRFH